MRICLRLVAFRHEKRTEERFKASSESDGQLYSQVTRNSGPHDRTGGQPEVGAQCDSGGGVVAVEIVSMDYPTAKRRSVSLCPQ